jgi:hypothetical protein
MALESEEEIARAWDHLRAEIKDKRAIRELNKSVYGVSGLTDVADWFLWERLETSGLRWELDVTKIEYLGSEVRKLKSGNTTYDATYYLVAAQGVLIVQGRPYPCVGAGENRRLDAAYKGAITSLFKNGCKWAGLTMSIYKGGPIDDDYFDSGNDGQSTNIQSPSASINTIPSEPTNPSEVINQAVAVFNGKIISDNQVKAPEPSQPVEKITYDKFNSNPVNEARIKILEQFNSSLVTPRADAWVRAMVDFWLLKSEQNQLTPEMIANQTGGTPINYAFQLLAAAHYEQCGRNCSHVSDCHKQLIEAGK